MKRSLIVKEIQWSYRCFVILLMIRINLYHLGLTMDQFQWCMRLFPNTKRQLLILRKVKLSFNQTRKKCCLYLSSWTKDRSFQSLNLGKKSMLCSQRYMEKTGINSMDYSLITNKKLQNSTMKTLSHNIYLRTSIQSQIISSIWLECKILPQTQNTKSMLRTKNNSSIWCQSLEC